jgi:hypothetical protein
MISLSLDIQQPSNNQFRFQGNVVKVNLFLKSHFTLVRPQYAHPKGSSLPNNHRRNPPLQLSLWYSPPHPSQSSRSKPSWGARQQTPTPVSANGTSPIRSSEGIFTAQQNPPLQLSLWCSPPHPSQSSHSKPSWGARQRTPTPVSAWQILMYSS